MTKSVNMFMGHYGYVLEYPTSYTALPSFDDPERTMERVLIYPKGTPPDEMGEPHYAKRGSSAWKPPRSSYARLMAHSAPGSRS